MFYKLNISSINTLCLLAVLAYTTMCHAEDSTLANYSVSEAKPDVPAIKVTRQDGATVLFSDEINDGRPVVLSFIFTSCAAICPILSSTLSSVQSKLGNIAKNAHIISVSIDPEYDGPDKLREYAKKFKAGDNWQFYSGSAQDIVKLQQAFGVYRGDKMNHTATLFIRNAREKTWARLDGFMSSDDIVREYSRLN